VDFQIATNFRTSLVPTDQISCERYKLCDFQLGAKNTVTPKSIAEILGGVNADSASKYRTWYSLVCDLKLRQVSLFRKGAFNKPFQFSLLNELEKGARKFDMDEFMGLANR
jgi:hypothetical protein